VGGATRDVDVTAAGWRVVGPRHAGVPAAVSAVVAQQ
jgi:hypothetical protein